ncbi:toll/interleukin-1 receptor domain-containing protein [Bacillus thuringiensis]|uniref:toll/interleukin-1 receptor domain-containing protein n=1 Tax=Bacillus thuringiensis TaxID=1428 RepID=UPI001CFAF9F4|nr:toll/interleukin-1 receptor domain-containing protein [Bacillus thuringiensis]
MKNNTSVFVSYSWDSEEHQKWVQDFTNDLRKNGLMATMDLFEFQKGTQNMNKMMIENIRDNDFIILVLTKKYSEKANFFDGGVGFENILSIPLLKENPNKFIFIVREESGFSDALPFYLKDYYAINFGKNEDYTTKFDELIHKLYKVNYWDEQPIGEVPLHIKRKLKGDSDSVDITITKNPATIVQRVESSSYPKPIIRINQSGIVNMTEEELEVSLSEISLNIKDGVVPPLQIYLEIEDKTREELRLDFSRNITDLERRKLVLKEKETSRRIEEYKKRLEDTVKIFIENPFVGHECYFSSILTDTFKNLILYISNQSPFYMGMKIDIYHTIKKSLYFSIHLTPEEWELLSEEQKECSMIYGFNYAHELPQDIKHKKLIPAYVDFLYNNFLKHNKPIPDEAQSLLNGWYFGLA